MNVITIRRLFPTPTGITGVISVDGEPICWSLEPPWRMNARNDSCIIPGAYLYKHYVSPKFERTCLQLHEVYGRDYVAVHPGNVRDDTKACILPGMYLGSLAGKHAVMRSNMALDLIVGCTSAVGTIRVIG
jgi:hypothetical protein